MTRTIHDLTQTERQRLQRQGRRILEQQFPLAFFSHGAIKKPLRLMVEHEIKWKLPDVDPLIVDVAFRDYVEGSRYLIAMIAGTPRIGLDGGNCEPVSNNAAATALQILLERERRGGLPPDVRSMMEGRTAVR